MGTCFICIPAFWIGAIAGEDAEKRDNSMAYCMAFNVGVLVVVGISMYLFATTHAAEGEGWFPATLKLFHVYPATSGRFDALEIFLWWIRLVLMQMAFGALSIKIHIETHRILSSGDLALRAFIGAGFCEELFKFTLTGTIWTFSKYNNSREAILQLSVASAAAFTIYEDILYAIRHQSTDVLGFRLVLFPLHICFNLAIAIGVARQRQAFAWLFEMLACLVAAVGIHGLYDFLIFTTIHVWRCAALYVLAPLAFYMGHAVYNWGLHDFEESQTANSDRQRGQV